MARTRQKNAAPPQEEPAADNLQSAIGEPKMDEETLEFIRAIDTYRRENNRPFPNWSEVLAILHALGYRKDKA